MSRICEICGKGRLRGKLVPRGIGRRVTHRTTHNQQVNLREKKLDLGGRKVKVKLCTSCLSSYNSFRGITANRQRTLMVADNKSQKESAGSNSSP